MIEEKKEPEIALRFIPIGFMLPAQEQPVEEKKIESAGWFGPAAFFTILIGIWYICYGWELWK